MDEVYRILSQNLIKNAVISALALIGLFALRSLALRALLKKDLPSEERRRLTVNSRNVTFLILLLVLVSIWAQELRSLAFSAVAIAAAIAISTKELLLCLSGSFYRARTRNFAVGDRIEIGNFRGDVIDQTLLATTLLEIGPGQSSHQHTGRTVVIPNALLLGAATINETFTGAYVLHVFAVPVKADEDWQAAETQLLAAAGAECDAYLKEAKQHFERMQKRYSLEPTHVEPRVSILMPEPGRVNLLVRIPVPARQKGRAEQAILRRFLEARALPGTG